MLCGLYRSPSAGSSIETDSVTQYTVKRQGKCLLNLSAVNCHVYQVLEDEFIVLAACRQFGANPASKR